MLKFFIFFVFRIYGFLHFNFPPGHTVYYLRGTVVSFSMFVFSFIYTLLSKKKHHHHRKKSFRNCFLCRFPSLRILLRLISENTKELDKNCSTVQNPCFDQNLEACRNFGIVKKSLCYEAMNEAIFEWQAIQDVFQNKLLLEFLQVS